MTQFLGIICIVLLLVFYVQGSQSCQQLGFKGTQLCKSCRQLGDMVDDEDLVKECLSCCVQDAQDTNKQYANAVLEVCRYRLEGYPHIQTFVNKIVKDMDNVVVRYRPGQAPRLLLIDGSARESFRIDHWKTEHIQEFLKDRLKQSA